MKGFLVKVDNDWTRSISTLTVEVGLVIDAKTKDRCEAADKFMDLLGEVEISKFKQDEEMKQDIQVGDVWEDGVYKRHVVKIHNGQVAYWLIKDEDLISHSLAITFFIKDNTLIKRDGKKVDQYEEGAYYAVRLKLTSGLDTDVARYKGNDHWACMSFENQRTDGLIIGEKLEIEWTEV